MLGELSTGPFIRYGVVRAESQRKQCVFVCAEREMKCGVRRAGDGCRQGQSRRCDRARQMDGTHSDGRSETVSTAKLLST